MACIRFPVIKSVWKYLISHSEIESAKTRFLRHFLISFTISYICKRRVSMIQKDQTGSKIIQLLWGTHASELPQIVRQFHRSLRGHPVSDEQLKQYNSGPTRTYPSKCHRTLQTCNRISDIDISDFACQKLHSHGSDTVDVSDGLTCCIMFRTVTERSTAPHSLTDGNSSGYLTGTLLGWKGEK